MTPTELWAWVDALNAIKPSEEYQGFFAEWGGSLLDEITQGRAIIANTSFDGGLLLSPQRGTVHVYRNVFKNIVSAYPLKLA